jgi:flagellar motor switch protein FliG
MTVQERERSRAVMRYETMIGVSQRAQAEVVDALRGLLQCEGRTERSPEEREAARQRVMQHVTQ